MLWNSRLKLQRIWEGRKEFRVGEVEGLAEKEELSLNLGVEYRKLDGWGSQGEEDSGLVSRNNRMKKEILF